MDKYIKENGITYGLRGEQYYPLLEPPEQKEIGTMYELEVDCQTGEIVKIDINMPELDFPNINFPSGSDAYQSGTLPDGSASSDKNTGAHNFGEGVQGILSPNGNGGEPEAHDEIPDNNLENGER